MDEMALKALFESCPEKYISQASVLDNQLGGAGLNPRSSSVLVKVATKKSSSSPCIGATMVSTFLCDIVFRATRP